MTAAPHKLVLLRHGESIWNKENRFTGWTDVPLSENGIAEAMAAGKTLKAKGYTFDLAFTSVLQRAIQTLRLVLEELGQTEIPVRRSWRLNERHYGALQGLDKTETARRHGEEQVLLWRRSYNLRPPAISPEDERFPGRDPLYSDVPRDELPMTESLKDTVERSLPCWQHNIAPQIKLGRRVIISAHGNSLRALVKYLDAVPDEDIVGLNIPTGIPLVYELDESLRPIKHQYLAAPEAVQRAIQAVADQGKSR